MGAPRGRRGRPGAALSRAIPLDALPPSRPDGTARDATLRLGLTVALGGWCMAFASLFLVLGYLRVRTPAWPPLDAPPLPVGPPALGTLLLLLSSAALVRGQARIRRGDVAGLVRGLALAAALGGAFLATQAWGWSATRAAGLSLSDGAYGATYYVLTAFHAAHVVMGLGVLSWLLLGAAAGRLGRAAHTPVTMAGMFWHFVGGMWLVTYVTVYLV